MKIDGDPAACAQLASALGQATGGVEQARKQHDRARWTSGCWSGPAEVAWQALTRQQAAQLDRLGAALHAASRVLDQFSQELHGAQICARQARQTAAQAGLELSPGGTIAPVRQDIRSTPELALAIFAQTQARHDALRDVARARQQEAQAHARLRQGLQTALHSCPPAVPEVQGGGHPGLPDLWGVGAWVNTAVSHAVAGADEAVTAAARVGSSGRIDTLLKAGPKMTKVLRFAPGVGIVATGVSIAIDRHDGDSWTRASVTNVAAGAAAGVAGTAVLAAGVAVGAPALVIGGGVVVVAYGVGEAVSWGLEKWFPRGAKRAPVPRPPGVRPSPQPGGLSSATASAAQRPQPGAAPRPAPTPSAPTLAPVG